MLCFDRHPLAVKLRCWKSALHLAGFGKSLADVMAANLQLDKSMDELIKMDVLRSFTMNKDYPRDTLLDVLKSGALVMDPAIGYCQGMNYIAGLFLIYFDREEAFQLFVRFIELKARAVFAQNFEMLQCYFYVVDFLVEVLIPDLNQVFKEQKIQAVFYSSSWIITVFTCALHHSEKSVLVRKIIDLFMVQGYKAIFKTIVALLLHFKEKLLPLSFEGIMEFLSDITQGEIFLNRDYARYKESKDKGASAEQLRKAFECAEDYEFVYNFKSKCRQIKIKDNFLLRIEKRYRDIKSKIDGKALY